MEKTFKKIIIVSGLIIILFLLLEAWRENLNMDWQKYQHKYKNELMYIAQTEQERVAAGEYEIKMRQAALPALNRFDRCLTCHVAMEDGRMENMEHPLKPHPGDYLETHDVNVVGCTSCHDGQGRAITVDDAHARGHGKYWEKPLLKGSFLESNCVRCHANTLAQTPVYNQGKELFKAKGCFACHSIGDIGGVLGPALSDIGDASFHVKMPTDENRGRLLEEYDGNVNLAYLHEAVVAPEAQPEETLMKKVELSKAEVRALLVYLKSLSSERRVMDVGVQQNQTSPMAITSTTKASAAVTGSSKVSGAAAKGFSVFSTSCVACHTVGSGDVVGPDLKGVTERREETWLKSFIQYPSRMIAEKDPIVVELMKKYPVPMADMGLTDEQVVDVIYYLQHPDQVTVEASALTSADSSKGAVKGEPTKMEVSKGIALFTGKERFLNGGPSCVACHDVRNDSVIAGGRLAKELTTSYSRLGAVGTSAILKNPPFPLMREAYRDKDLTSDEVSAVAAFLWHVDQEEGNQPPRQYTRKLLFLGLVGLVGLLGLYFILWFNRKKGSVNKKIFDRQRKSED